MNRIFLGAVLMSIGLSQTGFAQTKSRVQPEKMNCEDFLALADNYKPALLYWAAGVSKVDVKATDELIVDAANPVGLVVDECKKSPQTSFMNKVRQLTKSGRLNVVAHGDHG
ncbi:Acid stress chaperone HdeA [Paraburkholderia domus]|jgi:acid stress chaperone HdeA|uniref:Acid stress chaperone HdeA n=1 Tax=Paraburkholderia domus TaxID=2793075 RepID=A0A9N8MZ07_9BURK|nr:HdeA/HdeB family chaperone [Paraburkholderia domus]MBK5046840.1 HdeA [Burkholderia sp. R-70006]MBK5087695.1 HdeA [Burkholderia sp. R-69927]MBK5123425.1 HdeA [Burkholderia sp. R-69980]MBK5162836.1 HdeA [Burkholderia sp. R-70211]MBK5181410.1 HdeA [Burkholderia sp. R-69749]MCI0150706.1 HdeA family protein [Paraburkholderia sediminicola]